MQIGIVPETDVVSAVRRDELHTCDVVGSGQMRLHLLIAKDVTTGHQGGRDQIT